VKISHLSPTDLVARVNGPGLRLETGPFIFAIRTDLSEIADGLRILYADFSLADNEEFPDFQVEVTRPRSLRRWLKPQVIVYVDHEKPSLPLPLDQAFAAFEGCLNWCIYTFAHQYFIIHAAALERAGRAVILPAPPGSGKSTLCAALVNRGWRLLTDELTLIDPKSRAIIPIARPISLKNDSIEIIRHFAPQTVFGPLSPNTIKGTIAHVRPPADSVAQARESCTAAWSVFPKYRSASGVTDRGVPKAQAFMHIAGSSVNYTLFGAQGFTMLSEIMDGLSCYEFEYGDLSEAVAWFDKLQ
jgi:HprK-related kinase A